MSSVQWRQHSLIIPITQVIIRNKFKKYFQTYLLTFLVNNVTEFFLQTAFMMFVVFVGFFFLGGGESFDLSNSFDLTILS